jgi:hypothetical protein
MIHDTETNHEFFEEAVDSLISFWKAGAFRQAESSQ